MMDKNINNQRKSNRIQANIKVVFFCDHFQYTGTATNCSESGMCINTSHCISPDSKIDIILPLQEELKLTGVINRVENRENLSDVIGVELLDPPTNYYVFIQHLLHQ